MAIAILVLSILLQLLAILSSLRLVRRTGRGLPWLLLSAALALMAFRRLAALAGLLSDPEHGASTVQELIALAIAAIMLYAIRALGRVIDELQRGAADRRATEEVYGTLVANLPMVASAIDADGTLRILNPPQGVSMTGYGAEELKAPAFWRSLVDPEDLPTVEQAIARALRGETVNHLVRFRHKDGNWKSGEVVVYPRREGARITGVIALTSDVTERRTLEEQLRHAQKMEALGAMVGGMAHDFNNLLSSILGNVELAVRKVPADHPARKNLNAAARTALRAGEHTRQLLGFSRRTVLNPRPVLLNDVCREAVSVVMPAVDPRIEFAVRTEAGLWPAQGDPGELVQLFVNLLLNARDVLPEGGHVVVETANLVLDHTYARVHAEGRVGEFVRVVVTDDGPGMTPEVRARIFEPFFTTKAAGSGTGLGLAQVYATVRRHRGWIQCYSEPGRGTRFALYFPRVTPGEAADEHVPREQEAVPRGTETVLLVDDDDDLRTVGEESLRELGYSVLAARDGVEALGVFEAESERIRLVILDMSMPRMNGRDALARLRERNPDVRVLVTSGHALDDEARALLGQGAMGFVEKPYRLADIGRAVRAALDAQA